jgi:hypothetical protein
MKSGFMKIDLLSCSFSAAALFNTPDIFLKNCSRTNVNDLYQSGILKRMNCSFQYAPLLFSTVQNNNIKIKLQ